MPSPTPSTTPDPATYALLRLTLTPGLGPVLISRALAAFGSPEAILAANEHALRRIKGIGDDKSRQIVAGFADSARRADDELALAESLNARILAIHDPAYPPLLRQIPDPPPILTIRGDFCLGIGYAGSPSRSSGAEPQSTQNQAINSSDSPSPACPGSPSPAPMDQYPIAIVGSRACTQYGMEQAERFSMALAQCGLTIVSGGARGVDTAAHRAALRVKGRTLAVLGCGLAECYPAENKDLFDQIAAGSGAIISELPLRTPPNAENFPARNRIISGLSLGVLVVEAGRRSGALITARQAAEDHGREVFALPARVDSAAAQGSLDLLKSGGAQLVTHPDDILQALESPARHHFQGTHEARFAPARDPDSLFVAESDSALHASKPSALPSPAPSTPSALSPLQSSILEALDKPRGIDDLARIIAADPGQLRAEITILELRKRVARKGTILERITRP